MQKFLDACNQWSDDDEVMDLETADKVVGEIVEFLCTNEEVWTSEGVPVRNLSEFVDAFEDEIVLFTIDGGPEDGKVLNALADSCKDKTMDKLKKIMESQNEN
jgi:hypothetical protein